MTRIEGYLRDLRDELARRGLNDERFLTEASDHLTDAMQTALSDGRSGDEAERDVLERFGVPEVVAAGFRGCRWSTVDRFLAIVCGLAVLAVVWLSGSLFILRPPHADYRHWVLWAVAVLVHSALALATIAGAVPRHTARKVLIGGAVILLAASAWRGHSALSRPHFEGSWLVFTAMVGFQCALSLFAMMKRVELTL